MWNAFGSYHHKCQKALDEGLEVVDFETGKAITYENADKYVVLVDANHRFKAYLELRKSDDEYEGDFYVMYPYKRIFPLQKCWQK